MPLFEEGQEFSDVESGDEIDKWIEEMETEEMLPSEDGERQGVEASGGSPVGEESYNYSWSSVGSVGARQAGRLQRVVSA